MTETLLTLEFTLPPARSQGLRGTCVAFALTCAHEHERFGDPDGDALSEQALHWAAKEREPAIADAMSLKHGADALADRGQPYSSVWPYVDSGDPGNPPAGCFDRAFAAKAQVLTGVRRQELRDALVSEQVVCAGIPVWPEFLRAAVAASGVVPFTTLARALTPSHAVALVGHDPDAAAVLVRNSWGPTWGMDGSSWVDEELLGYCSSMWRIADLIAPIEED